MYVRIAFLFAAQAAVATTICAQTPGECYAFSSHELCYPGGVPNDLYCTDTGTAGGANLPCTEIHQDCNMDYVEHDSSNPGFQNAFPNAEGYTLTSTNWVYCRYKSDCICRDIDMARICYPAGPAAPDVQRLNFSLNTDSACDGGFLLP